MFNYLRNPQIRMLNGTFLENILFGQPEDAQKLQETLESCALLQDKGCTSQGGKKNTPSQVGNKDDERRG